MNNKRRRRVIKMCRELNITAREANRRIDLRNQALGSSERRDTVAPAALTLAMAIEAGDAGKGSESTEVSSQETASGREQSKEPSRKDTVEAHVEQIAARVDNLLQANSIYQSAVMGAIAAAERVTAPSAAVRAMEGATRALGAESAVMRAIAAPNRIMPPDSVGAMAATARVLSNAQAAFRSHAALSAYNARFGAVSAVQNAMRNAGVIASFASAAVPPDPDNSDA